MINGDVLRIIIAKGAGDVSEGVNGLLDQVGELNTKIKVLNNNEMVNLFKKYKEGDLKAKEELINGNLKLVLSILKKYNQDLTTRAEQITIETFVDIANNL